MIGDVLELVLVGDVADRPDAIDDRAHVFVDDDRSMVVTRQSTQLGVEQVAVGLAAGGDQQLVDLDHLTHAVDRDRIAAALDLRREVFEMHVDPLREHLGEAL